MNQQGLIRFCSPVIKLYGELSSLDEKLEDASDLYDELYGLISALEIELEDAGFSKSAIRYCSYSLCCVLDSALNHAKGITDQEMLASESLLLSIHNEVVDSLNLLKLARTLIDDKKTNYSEVLGLIYVLFEMGYKDYITKSGESLDVLAKVQTDIANKLAINHKPMINVIGLGLNPAVKEYKRNSRMPLWVSLSLAFLVLIGSHRVADLFLTNYYEATVKNIKTSTIKISKKDL